MFVNAGLFAMSTREAIDVAVVIERVAQPNGWQPWSFRLVEVLPDEGAFGKLARCLRDDGKLSQWLHPGWCVQLFADECKGYFLNLTSGRPVWFVSWVPDENDPAMVQLTGVSLSYIEADRRLTADEVVENLALEPELCEWLRVFTNNNFRPDTGRKVRAMSFLSPQEREQHAQASAKSVAADAAAADPVATNATPEVSTAEPELSSGPGRTADTEVATSSAAEAEAQARQQALREWFHSDPHFQQPDELNVANDEVVEELRSPLSRQRKIEQARALGLLDDDLLDQPGDPHRT